MTRTLITGSRDWEDEEAIAAVINQLPLDAVVIHGAAPGADSIADRLAKARGLAVEAYPADWKRYGSEAGSIRNQEMLDRGHPTEAYAFPLPASRGTWDMVRRLRKSGVPVKICSPSEDAEVSAIALAAADESVGRLRAFDSETHVFRPGRMAPPIVCASTSRFDGDGRILGELLPDPTTARAFFKVLLDSGQKIAFANAAYDLAVMAQADPSFLVSIKKALREDRVHDLLIAEALNAIYHGHLGAMPDGRPLHNPATGKETKRYSLALAVLLALGRSDAKENDTWKKAYALLEGIPLDRWPVDARQYPVDDAVNTLEVAATQLVGQAGKHSWTVSGTQRVCRWCGSSEVTSAICVGAPRKEAHRNLGNLAAQCETDFALKLGACWSLRTDPERVEKLAQEVEEKHQKAVERFQKKGWIRANGTEDQSAVKRAVALAYGATGVCPRCHGGVDCVRCGGSGRFKDAVCTNCDGIGHFVGKIAKVTTEKCRGQKEHGRFQGCLGPACSVCRGAGQVCFRSGEVTCKNEFDERGTLLAEGCDGTGLDLLTAGKILPRTDTFGVGTDRDAKMESGDEDLADYGEDEFEKARSTYVPYLRTGILVPLKYSPNVIVATGRCSYEDSPLHQMPRAGKERSCIRARGAWCGSPIEYVLGSTDYEAGELCTLSQLTYWLFGHSEMRATINATGKPGILHSDLAASVLGISLDEFLKRYEAKDKQAKDFRQAMKCFHPDTEILTRRRGWVRIADLTMEDEVASVVAENCNFGRRSGHVQCECLGCGKKFEVKASEVEKGGGRNCSRACANKSRGRSLSARHEDLGAKPTKKEDRELPVLKIEWTRPLRLTRRKATEGLLHLKNQSIDLRVTPDHRMLTYGGTQRLQTIEAKDFGKQRGWFNAGMLRSGDVDVDERLLRLAVAAQADGTYLLYGEPLKKVKFGFSKKRKIERLESLLREGEYYRSLCSNGQHQPTTWFTLSEELSTKVKALLDGDKTLPWWWLELRSELREAVLDEATFWDSHKGVEMNCYLYFSSIKKNVDVLQAIASVTNRKAQSDEIVPVRENEQVRYTLSVKDKYDTRGENVEIEKIDYDGDVYCLSVSSTYVLVRDGGVPVVTGQCINFGTPGGMGTSKLVLTNRKKNAGFTVAERGPAQNEKGQPGYWGIRFCILTGHALECGTKKITQWKRRECAPVCEACCKIVEDVLRPAYFKRYPEVKEYFKWASKLIDKAKREKKNVLAPCAVWDASKGRPEVIRERGLDPDDYSALCNNGFQAMLADIGKDAFARATWECYLGVKEDGSPSPLAGCRLPMFLHDEPLSELILETAHLAGPRIAEIMMESGRRLAPDVTWRAETALSFYWYKSMEPVYDKTGKLIPWYPEAKAT